MTNAIPPIEDPVSLINRNLRSTFALYIRRDFLLALALIFAVFLVYYPAWHGGFLLDDDTLCPPVLRGWHGLYRIWFQPGSSLQYYPLTYSLFWIQHSLWGDYTLGYHLLNIALHAAAAILVAVTLRQLAVPGAELAAAIFALHPVQVESVAWIIELKNTLSAVFFLLAALLYLRFDQNREISSYTAALLLFLLALLSKTTSVTLPAALLVAIWWRRGRFSWQRDLLPLVPFVAFGIMAGLTTIWVENYTGAPGTDSGLSFLQRFLLAGRAVCFYLGKIFWPTHLYMFYPRYPIDPYAVWQYACAVAVLALLAPLVWLCKYWRSPLAAVVLFILTLLPVLGFFNVSYFIYSFFADHFLYLPLLAVAALFSAGVALGLDRADRFLRLAGYGLCLALLVTLGMLSWRQCGMYIDGKALYQKTLAENPGCWVAHNNLALILARQGQVDDAILHFRQAVQLNPESASAHNNLGYELARKGLIDEALPHLFKAVRYDPRSASAHANLGYALAVRGSYDQAIQELQLALQLDPGKADAARNLAQALACRNDPARKQAPALQNP